MRRTFIILALAALSAYAVDCIRATFNYILIDRSYWEFTPDNLYIDSSYSQNKSMINTSKFYWSGNKLDSIKMHMSCRDNRKDWTVAKDWKVEKTKQGTYTWTDPMPMSIFQGKDSLDISIDGHRYTLLLRNDTIFEKTNDNSPQYIIIRDPNNRNKCYRTNKSGLTITTFEYEMQGSTLIQKMVKPDHNKYFRNPGPCSGGDKYTTIYYNVSRGTLR